MESSEINNYATIDYGAVLEDLKKKRDELDKAIAGIETILGLNQSSKATGSVHAQAHVQAHGQTQHLGEDAFFGMSIIDAAIKYLNIKKKPQATKNIAEALLAGGLINQSGNFGNTVGSVIHRNANSNNPNFVSISRGTWGLTSWYGNRRPKSKNGTNKSDDNTTNQEPDDGTLIDPDS